jgi:general secretion pathway protein D
LSRLVVDESTNSLLLVATEAVHGRVLALVRRLEEAREQAAGDEEGYVHFCPLRYANADELAQTLAAMVGVQVASSPASAHRSEPPRAGAPSGAGPGLSSPSGTVTPAPAQSVSTGPPPARSPFEGEVRVIPEHTTNGLVVVASLRDFLAVEKLVARLDTRRRQVLLEATIVEVSMDRLRSLGVSFHGGSTVGSGNDQPTVFGGVAASTTLGAATSDGQKALFGDLASGAALGVLGTPFQALPGVSIPSFGVFLRALATSSDVHVLSAPQLLTMDNEPAQIVVGENVPFPTVVPTVASSTASGSSSTPAPFFSAGTSIERRDVGLTLAVTPQINEGGMVRLKVVQEVTDVLDTGSYGPTTSKRRIETNIEVDDQQPVVLGGLMTERTQIKEDKVPVLGDLPILGYFFKSSEKQLHKTNLLVFLTPYVIRDRSDLKRIYERKQREARELEERLARARGGDARRDALIDYRHKHGLLEEMNLAAREADDDQARLARVRATDLAAAAQEDRPVEPAARSPESAAAP